MELAIIKIFAGDGHEFIGVKNPQPKTIGYELLVMKPAEFTTAISFNKLQTVARMRIHKAQALKLIAEGVPQAAGYFCGKDKLPSVPKAGGE